MRSCIALTLMLVAPIAVADPKLLVCEETWMTGNDVPEKMERSSSFIFDTDDFGKENPEAEVTISKWKEEGEPYVGIPGYATATTGRTYRMKYSVTPSTLSFTLRVYTETLDYNSHESTIDLSRKDLTHRRGNCTIEDYKVENAI